MTKYSNSALLFSFVLLTIALLIIYLSPAFILNSSDGISKSQSRSILGALIFYYVLYAISIAYLFRSGARYFNSLPKAVVE